jgi:hypothetical protein
MGESQALKGRGPHRTSSLPTCMKMILALIYHRSEHLVGHEPLLYLT